MIKAWEWIKKKWQIVVGFVVSLVTLLLVMSRSRQQKEVLKVANESHEKETQINEKAKEDLVDGLTDINKTKEKEIEEIKDTADAEEKALNQEKKEFVEEAAKSDDLAKKIADHLGAEHVVTNDE